MNQLTTPQNGPKQANFDHLASEIYNAGPDVLIVHGGSVFGIELKRPGCKLSRTRMVRTRRGGLRILLGQEDVHPRLIAAGMKLAVCHDLQAVIAQLTVWGIPLRGEITP